ncbi:hypothetical protein K440DRAFT_548699, partial [Wilcoxina mikolae CBS 423.85]
YIGQILLEEIKRDFYVSSPDLSKNTPTGRRLWHNKVDIILDQLRDSSLRYHMPSTYIFQDLCMKRVTGWSPDTYKISCKPIEQGYKFHYLADHGYIWDFHLTSNLVLATNCPGFVQLTNRFGLREPDPCQAFRLKPHHFELQLRTKISKRVPVRCARFVVYRVANLSRYKMRYKSIRSDKISVTYYRSKIEGLRTSSDKPRNFVQISD